QGVMITGLGTFAMVEEQFRGEEEVYVIRRPIFQLDTDALCLQEVMVTTEVIPGNVTIEPLDYRQISQATSLLQQVVKSCVQETILLYSLHLRNRQHPSFAFKDIGVLSCKDNILYMWFYYDCVTGLESKAGQIALLHT
ncbi:Coiled-coil domain-containing protein 81, partial [Leptosomus discolor]